MSPKWLNSLVRARQLQEEAAKQQLATAERLALRAHARARYADERLDTLIEADVQPSTAAFVAAAAALQASAASHAAACTAAQEAESEVTRNRETLGDTARRRKGAEELQERIVAAEVAQAAAHAQRDLDEVAARIHRDGTDPHEGGAP